MFVGGLIALALIAALVGPYFIDWSSYRADFEREASAILGRKVTVEGEASARLLPFPSLSFTEVSVGATKDAAPALTVDSFSMDAELAPFLRGEFLIFDMRLVRPKGVVEISQDGAVDWAMRPSAPFSARKIAIEKLTVTEGQLLLRHAASGREHKLSEINAEVSAKTLAGPWRVDGSMRFDGQRTRLSASTGTADDSGSLGLRLRVDADNVPGVAELDGSARLDGGRLVYAGRFVIGPKPAPAADGRQAVVAAPEAAETVNRLSGEFSIDHRRIAVDAFRFETGAAASPYVADGKGYIELGAKPRFDIEAKGAQVLVDDKAADGTVSKVTLAQRLVDLEEGLASLPKPAIPGSIKVDLPAIVAGDTTIRDIKLSAEPVAAGWAVQSLSATLPGRTTLEADGLLRMDSEFGFQGSLLLAVAQPSGFAAWLSRDVDDAIRRLPAAGFNATVDLTPRRQIFSDLELVLGGARFVGEIDHAQPPGARPSMVLRLEGGALDLDGAAALASIFVSNEGASRFAGHDLDLRLKAGPVSTAGVSAETVDAMIRLSEGQLDIDRLSIGGLAGASLSATGKVRDMATHPLGQVDASIVAADLAPLVTLGADRFPTNAWLGALARRAQAHPELFTDARIDLVATRDDAAGDGAGLRLTAQGLAGGSDLKFTLSGGGDIAAFRNEPLDVSFSARNEDAARLLALYGFPALPVAAPLGAAETSWTAKGIPASGLAATFSFKGERFRATFEGTAAVAENGPTGKGRIALEAADVEPWLASAGLLLPGMGFGLPVELEAEADYGSGLVVVAGLGGTLGENAIGGDVNVEWTGGRPHLTGALAVDAVDLAPAAALVVGEAALNPSEGPWPSTPFAQTSQLPFTADLDLSAGAFVVGSAATVYDANLSLRLDDDGIAISDLAGKLFGGTASGLIELANNRGSGLFSAQLTLKNADLALAAPGTGISGNADLSASVSASGKSLGGLVASLSGSGTANLRAVEVEGLDAGALPSLLAKADAVGRDIDAARTASFAPETVRGGTFAGGDAAVAFTVAGGVLRTPSFTLGNKAAILVTEVRAHLGTLRVAAEGTVTYAAGEEALVGSEPALRFTAEGPLDAIQTRFDTEPLAQFLAQRALEREQARVEALQASLLEKQRLRREVRYYASLQDERDRVAEEERRAEEEARLRAQAEARAAEQARADAEAARAQAEAQARRREIVPRAAPQPDPARVDPAPSLTFDGLPGVGPIQ